MSKPAVLLIGASGFLGSAVTEEFLTQKSKFKEVAILAAPEKVVKFEGVRARGVKIVVGSFTDSSSFKGKCVQDSSGMD